MTTRKNPNWNSKGPEGKKLLELFTTKGLIDPSNKNKDYILSVQDKYPVFSGFKDSVFLSHYKSLYCDLVLGRAKQGGRLEFKCFILFYT